MPTKLPPSGAAMLADGGGSGSQSPSQTSKLPKLGSQPAHGDGRYSINGPNVPEGIKSPAQLTRDALELLREFLMYLDPLAAQQLPIETPPGAEVPIPISDWNIIYSTAQKTAATSSIVVSSYPSPTKNLFCVQSVLPGVSARQFWTLMAESGNRHLWDSTVQEGGNFRWFEDELQESPRDAALARSVAARVEYLKMGAIFLVAKPRDMVLLSADVRLPPSADSPLRMVSGCRSETDPSKPPQKGYTRWPLGVGGFMVEELGDDGLNAADTAKASATSVRVTQLSDLGELASWVPSSVVKMVASSLVPRSLNLISKAAMAIRPPEALKGPEALPGSRLRDEHVVKGAERWSHGRGLPLQVGKGVLAKEKACGSETTGAGNSDDVTVSYSPIGAKELPPSDSIRESSRELDHDKEPRPVSSEELPLLSLSLQRLSTRLQESTPSPMSPATQDRLAQDDYFARRASPGSTTLASSREGARRLQDSASTSPLATASEADSYLTFGVPSGEDTVPGSLAPSSGQSSSRASMLSSDGSEAISPPENEDGSPRASVAEADVGDETIVVGEGRSPSQSNRLSTATETTVSTRSSADGNVPQSLQLSKRLQRISRALQSEYTEDGLCVQTLQGHRTGTVAAESSTKDFESRRNNRHSEMARPSHGSDELADIMAEALSISLQSPELLPRFSPQSPRKSGRGTSNASAFLIQSPSRNKARREASELSAMLLAGSDAIVTALAPGARETFSQPLAAESELDFDRRSSTGSKEHTPRMGGLSQQAAANALAREAEDIEPNVSSEQIEPLSSASDSQETTQGRHACKSFFQGSRPASRRACSSSRSPAQASSTHATSLSSSASSCSVAVQRLGVPITAIPPTASIAHLGSTPAVLPASSSAVAPLLTKSEHGATRQSRGARPYNVILGMMAMLWIKSSGSNRKSMKSRRKSTRSVAVAAAAGKQQDLRSRQSTTVPRRMSRVERASDVEGATAVSNSSDVPRTASVQDTPAMMAARRLLLLQKRSSTTPAGQWTGVQGQRSVAAANVNAGRMSTNLRPRPVARSVTSPGSAAVHGAGAQQPHTDADRTRYGSLGSSTLADATGRRAVEDRQGTLNSSSSSASYGSAIRIPSEEDDRRRRTRANYRENAKLMTLTTSTSGEAAEARNHHSFDDNEVEDAGSSGWASWVGSYLKSS